MITLIPTDGPRLHGVSLPGYTFLATSQSPNHIVFSHDLSHHVKVYDTNAQSWLDEDNVDFPRFCIEDETATHGMLIDLEHGERHEVQWVVGGEQ